MTTPARARYAGYRFPAEIIGHAVWLYFRFPLGLRMVEELLAARGIIVSHETVRQWARKFGQQFANRIRRRLPRVGDKWHLDEVVLKIAGVKHRLWRAVDQTGIVLDVLVQSRRNKQAAKRLLRSIREFRDRSSNSATPPLARISFTTRSSAARSRPETTTFAPRIASACAIPAPIPREPPVTSATRPAIPGSSKSDIARHCHRDERDGEQTCRNSLADRHLSAQGGGVGAASHADGEYCPRLISPKPSRSRTARSG